MSQICILIIQLKTAIIIRPRILPFACPLEKDKKGNDLFD